MQSISCKVVRALFKFNSNYIIKLNRAHLGGLSFFKFQACNFIKNETLAQMFSCEFCEISKNIFLQNTSGRLLLPNLTCVLIYSSYSILEDGFKDIYSGNFSYLQKTICDGVYC